MSASEPLRVKTADLSLSKPPSWAWQDRLPVGYLSLLIGAEGSGKSTLACWILARLTRGQLAGDLQGEPVNVAVVGDEDSAQMVWTPRLRAAGADLSRVRFIDRPDGGYVNLKDDKDRLADVLHAEQIGYAFFDSMIDNLGASTNDWRAKDVREALQPLRIISRDLDISVTGSLHPNKRGSSFRELVAGSSAFNAISRSSLLLAEHPQDPARKVIVRGKGNLSAAPSAVDFEIQGYQFDANGYHFNEPQATDFKIGDTTIGELIDKSSEKVQEQSQVGDAVELIEELLPRDGCWYPASTIYAAAEIEDIGRNAIKRAKKRLALENRRASTFQAPSEWRWPTGVALGSSAQSEPSDPSELCVVIPANNTQLTQITQITENTRAVCDPTGDDRPPLALVSASANESHSLEAGLDVGALEAVRDEHERLGERI
jgi:AAA domain